MSSADLLTLVLAGFGVVLCIALLVVAALIILDPDA